MASAKRMGRVGPLPIEGFYARFIGMPQPPQTWKQWRLVPEQFLAVSTNELCSVIGLGLSRLSVKRCWASIQKMSASKIAARCMGMAQAGQYNLLRSLKRGRRQQPCLPPRFRNRPFQ